MSTKSTGKSKINLNLGKGILDGLEEIADINSGYDSTVVMVDINKLVTNLKNFYSKDGIAELAEQIENDGLLHNLVVRPNNNGTYIIISGERRYRACKKINEKNPEHPWARLPCKIRDDINDDLDEKRLIINANKDARERSDWEKAQEIFNLEEIFRLKKLTDKSEELKGKVRSLIAKDMDISESNVQKYLGLKKLIPEFQNLLHQGNIALQTAMIIADKEKDTQINIYELLPDKTQKIYLDDITRLVSGTASNEEIEFVNINDNINDKNKVFDEIQPNIVSDLNKGSSSSQVIPKGNNADKKINGAPVKPNLKFYLNELKKNLEQTKITINSMKINSENIDNESLILLEDVKKLFTEIAGLL